MIKLTNVTKEYRLDESTIISPIKEINLEVDKGEFLMIVGRSGSGKTTLLNLCAGLIRPTSGEVSIDNTDINRMTDEQLSALRSKKIGFIFQFQSLFSNLTIRENVAIPASSTKTIKDPMKRAAELLEMVGLNDRMNVYPKQLSAGELRRVAIARSLMNKPEILLADEPTADLDEQTEREIVAVLSKIHQSGITVLMITHNMDLVPNCTRALKVEDGSLKPFKMDETRSQKANSMQRDLIQQELKTVGSVGSKKSTGTVYQQGRIKKKRWFSTQSVVGLALLGVALAVLGIRFLPGLASSSTAQVVVTENQTKPNLILRTVNTELGKEFSLRSGQSATINEEKMNIRFKDLATDSRCPTGAQCVWAGQITCIVEIMIGGDNSTSFNLPLVQPGWKDSASTSVGKYALTFSVDPYPVAGKTVSESEYTLNIIISDGKALDLPSKASKPKGGSM